MVEPVDLRRLQVLRLVHERGTVTSAAELLHLTPSAVSHQIRQLSRELGVPLLERTGRRVRLTPAAQRLIGHADALHARWEQAHAELADPLDARGGLLRMCGFPTAVAGLLAPAADYLRTECPRLSVHVSEAETEQGFGLLLAGDVDIAVVLPTMAAPPLTNTKFSQQPLMEEPLDLLVPEDHPLATRAEVQLIDVARDPWVLAAAGSCDFYELVQAACATAGFTPEVAHHAKDAVAVSALVASGLGVALAPRLAAVHLQKGAVRIPLRGHPRPTRRLLACVRPGSEDHPSIERGLDALRTVATTAV
ncbi:MAG: LysR family transcriptional regulator [Nocardioidaceae bacterium]